jgi:protein-disulfide isomerase-like protein with CxxC motif
MKNKAEEIRNDGIAAANLISAVAQANYTAILETARAKGMKHVLNEMGFSQQEHKNSFNYLRALRELPIAHFTVDFQQRIAGNL